MLKELQYQDNVKKQKKLIREDKQMLKGLQYPDKLKLKMRPRIEGYQTAIYINNLKYVNLKDWKMPTKMNLIPSAYC